MGKATRRLNGSRPDTPRLPAVIGRPKKHIDWKLFEDLCGILCTRQEIAHILRVDLETLRSRAEENYELPFSDVYNRYTSSGKVSLRRMQFKLAARSAAMAIWLGKHWLEQKDTMNLITTTPENEQQLQDLMKNLRYLQNNRAGMQALKQPDTSSAEHLASV